MSNTTLYLEDEEKQLPTKWCICDTCSGEGKSSAYLGVINTEEWDDESLQDYARGVYDRRCEECKGSGKIKVVDEDRLSPEELKLWKAQERERWACEREEAMERRMGA